MKNIAGLWRGERRAVSSCSCSVLIREKAVVVVVVVVCLSALQQNITATAEIIIMTTLTALLLGAREGDESLGLTGQ